MRLYRVGFQKNPLFIKELLAPSAPPKIQGVSWKDKRRSISCQRCVSKRREKKRPAAACL